MKPTGDLTYECANAPDQLSVGDGICDAENNIFGCFDGGDCCTSTCGDSKNCEEPKDECHDPRAPDFALFECPFPELFADRANRITSKCKSAKWDCENPSETCLGQLDALEEYGEMSVCLSKAFHRLSERTREVFRQKAQCCPMRRAKCDMLNDVGAIFDMRGDSSHSLPCALSATRERVGRVLTHVENSSNIVEHVALSTSHWAALSFLPEHFARSLRKAVESL